MDANKQNTCQYAQITDVGCVRELNEDSLYCGEGLWLVADGMGGHACGEVASQIAAQSIPVEFEQSGDLPEAIQVAHKKVVEEGLTASGRAGMGTTVVALNSRGERYEIAWVGDSRAYLWDARKKRIKQLTEDHSLIVRLVNSGLISKDDAKNHPQRHMITQCLGSIEIETLQVDTVIDQWYPEEQVLLCSDGLSDDVSEQELSNILIQAVSNEHKLTQLVELAKSKGGKDNISCILIDSPVSARPTLWDKIKARLKIN